MRRITFKDAADSDIKRENANIDGDTAMGTMLRYGSEAAKQFSESFLMKPEYATAHERGDIHIHDLDFYALTTTCCQIDLLSLFHGGFSTGLGHIREPQSIASYASLACIAIQSNQNDQHGGQSIVNFDYAMAEGVAQDVPRLLPPEPQPCAGAAVRRDADGCPAPGLCGLAGRKGPDSGACRAEGL